MKIAVLLAAHHRPDRIDALVAALPSALSLPHETWALETSARGPGSRHTKLWLAAADETSALRVAHAAARLACDVDCWIVVSPSAELGSVAGGLDTAVERVARDSKLALFTLSAGGAPVRVLSGRAIAECGFLAPNATLDGAFTELAERCSARGWRVESGSAAQSSAAAQPVRPPFAIATQATERLFAWPDWKNQSELARLLDEFARPLVGRADACLCLRRDPRLDPSGPQVLAALEAAHARVLGPSAAIEVTIVDDELGPDRWAELEREITHAVALPSSRAGERAALYAALGRKVVHRADALESKAANQASSNVAAAQSSAPVAPALPNYSRETLDAVDWKVVEAIKSLHPWFYPVVLGNLKVTPGVGSHVAADFLENRTACRQTLLVDEVARRYELANKSVLELACNCGYWSARYAERGATRVVGLEGRDAYVRQAELYWSTNGFLPREKYDFLLGNVSDEAAWSELRARGPFDVTLCAGILYHVPNYREVLGWAAEVTREALIVDTRVSDEDEAPIEEPGELYFNAIRETRVKVVPNRGKLVAALRELGFAAEILPVGFRAQLGVEDVDDYAAGKAVTILARRVAAPRKLTVRTASGFSA